MAGLSLPVPLWYARRRPVYQGGHEVALLEGGEALFPAMVRAIDAATDEVWLAVYLFNDDPSAEQVARALDRAARRGVRVRVVVDGFGCHDTLVALRRWWQGGPVAWVVYRPLDRWWRWLQPGHLRRMHAKLCVVDGEWAFVGGINLIDDRIDQHHGALDAPRLDYAVGLRGPAVEAVTQTVRALWSRAAFGADWRDGLSRWRQAGPGLAALRQGLQAMRWPRVAPTEGAERAQGSEVAFVLRDNLRQRRGIEVALLEAMDAAQSHIDIACAYFYPGRWLRRSLKAAAQRGVQVRLLLQGQVDLKVAGLAAEALYGELLQAGVQIYEYTPAFLHAKVVRVDGCWATVGSSNLDPLSMWVNFEANVAVRDEALVARLAASLQAALAVSRPVTPTAVASGWSRRLKPALVSLLVRLYLRVAGVRHLH